MTDSRLCRDWLKSYLDYTSDLESPEPLHLWTGITVISAALRRQVYLELMQGNVYPNMYTIIVAESAKIRKSSAMDVGRDLLIEAMPEMKIMRDSMTSQGLIKSLNKPVESTDGDKTIKRLKSDVAIFADEVANLFSYDKTRASQMVIFLTRTYTCPSIYDHTTARDSTVRLHNLYPVLLGGTDPRNLKVLPEDAIGGLTGRLVWVIEKERRKNMSGWKEGFERRVAERNALREMLIHDIQHISTLAGVFSVNKDARDFYDVWYDALSKKDERDPTTDAFYHRCHTTALRIAMILSISEDDELVISIKQMAAAVRLVELQLPEVKRAVSWSGGSIYEQQRSKFLHFLSNSGGAAFERVLLKYMGVNNDEFGKIRDTLIEDGSIVKSSVKVGQDFIIKMLQNPNGSQPAAKDQSEKSS